MGDWSTAVVCVCVCMCERTLDAQIHNCLNQLNHFHHVEVERQEAERFVHVIVNQMASIDSDLLVGGLLAKQNLYFSIFHGKEVLYLPPPRDREALMSVKKKRASGHIYIVSSKSA